jgi:hypothetical protein
MKNLTLTLAGVLLVASAGCFDFEHKSSLAPSASGAEALVGRWSSSNIVPSPTTCTDFTWDVTEQTGVSASGNFSATCAGSLQLTGSARGTLAGSTVSWSANGDAQAPDLPACAVTLQGTAELTTDSIRVPYTGQTCLGPVSGVENLRRR